VRQFSWVAAVVGIVTVVATWLCNAAGLFGRLELASADWRYRHARSEPVPLAPDIALVVLDDTALEVFGRWPWSRTRIADAIDELAYLGVKTLAMDIQFSEPEGKADDTLGAAVSRVPTVVGLDVSKQWVPGTEWETPEGKAQMEAVVRCLMEDLELDQPAVEDAARLNGLRIDQYRAHAVWFKQLAVWNAIWREYASTHALPSSERLAAMLRKGRIDPPLSDGDQQMVEQLLRHAKSWLGLQHEMVVERDRLVPLGGHSQVPPIPQLAAAARALGVLSNVQSPLDTDGDKRRTPVVWQVPGGEVFQIGLVAAAAHRGLKPSDVSSDGSAVKIGAVTLPLRDGELYLDWPTSTFDGGFADWTQAGMGGSERPTVSIGQVLDLHTNRSKNAANCAARDQLKAKLVAAHPDLQRPELQAKPQDLQTAVEDLRMDLEGEQREAASAFLKLEDAIKEAAPRLQQEELNLRKKLGGKLVFIGWTATGANADFVPTALDARTPGVFVHVVAANMVLADHGRHVAPAWLGPLALVTLGLVATVVAASLSVAVSSVIVLVLVGGWLLLGGGLCFREFDLIVPLVGPTASPIASWATATAVVAVLTARDRARINRQFSARVSPQLVAKLSGDPEALSMSGEEREITVMFGDLAGFTSIAEALGGPEVVRTLNTYLGTISEELVDRNAYVNKFLGDGFMAFWSAFGDEARQESMAAESAVACQRAVAELGKSAKDGSPKISLRLGIATGDAVVGDCGAPPKLNDYTAIGDCVNLSARLESANKQFGTAILMDGPTHRGFISQGGNPNVRTRALGAIVVVGQSKPVEIFEVCPADADGEWVAATEAAVGLFREKRTADAEQAWRAFESKYGPSKLSAMYLEAVEDVRSGDAPEDGVLHLRAK
jgi:class 3 adenylate cyclase/CHASE2 domain-containing sensor protein